MTDTEKFEADLEKAWWPQAEAMLMAFVPFIRQSFITTENGADAMDTKGGAVIDALCAATVSIVASVVTTMTQGPSLSKEMLIELYRHMAWLHVMNRDARAQGLGGDHDTISTWSTEGGLKRYDFRNMMQAKP